MFDASALAFEDNMAQTAHYVERFGKRVIVEGAVDEIFESGTGEQKNQITTVPQAKRYVEKTGVDLIVPNLGTEHRASARELRYHTDDARTISAAVGKILVLHGTSSLSPQDFKHLKDDGIMKVNIWTAIEKAGAQGAVRKALDELGNTFPEADLRELQRRGILGPACFEPNYVQKTCGGRLWPKLDHFAEAVRRDAWIEGAQAVVEGCLEDLGYGAFGR
jgi:fructose/tagatose bisphosphate aldolase